MAARAAPLGSMERHSRRADVLTFALRAIQCAPPTTTTVVTRPPGGCCSPAAFDAALAMLETEGNVALGGPAAAGLPPGSPAAGAAELQVEGVERVARRFAHAYPWSGAASVHLALCVRRRAAGLGPPAGQRGEEASTDVAAGAGALPARQWHRISGASRRRRLIKVRARVRGALGARVRGALVTLGLADLLSCLPKR